MKIESKNTKLAISIVVGVAVGALVYSLINWLFNKFMMAVFKCEALGCFDATFLLDSPDNIANCIGCVFFEKFEFEEMKDHILAKT